MASWSLPRQARSRRPLLEAVRLIKVRGVSYAQASQDLNVHVSQLRDWVKCFPTIRSTLPRQWPDEARAARDRASQARSGES
jgi:transposase-like protein